MPKTLRRKARLIDKPITKWSAGLILLLLLIFSGYYLFIRDTKPIVGGSATTPFDTSSPQQKQQDAAENAAKKQKVGVNDGGQPTQSGTSNDTNSSINLSAKQETNGSVTVFTKLYGYSNGTCSLVVSNGGATVNQTAAIIYAPEYSSCAGFSVPISSLRSGSWTIVLNIESNGLTSSKTINFNVT